MTTQDFELTDLLHKDTSPQIDPVTYEVIRHNLWNVNEEHAATIVKVSGSPIVVFGHDFNPSILTEDGEWVGMTELEGAEVALELKPEQRWIVNPGSVGQPRDGDPRA